MQTSATTLCWTVLVLGNLMELLSYKWQQNVSFWWSAFPFSGDKLAETKHIWVCVGKHMWHSVLMRLPQPGEPNQGSQTLAQMWGVARWGVYPPGMWHCSVFACPCVSFLQADFTQLPCALRSSSSVGKCACTAQGNQTGTSPRVFHWLSMGQKQVFLGIKWCALRSAEVPREAKNGFLKCSWMVVREIYFYLPCVCTEASMHDFLLLLESFKHMVNRLSMGWNLLLQEMLLQIVFPLQCIEGFSCHPQHMLWNTSGL